VINNKRMENQNRWGGGSLLGGAEWGEKTDTGS